MRYAIFTDIHANLEALETVLAKIDEISQQEPIDQIWFLGDLVGYGPNPNECITKLRERTDVIIAGNHDWAAVGKIDLEDFSDAARISAEWTAQQLTEEHRTFLMNLPERIEKDGCTLVHGSPYGPLWEYLTSEVLAERSFDYFNTRYCFVGHTHVPVIFQQPYSIANTPTIPLSEDMPDAAEQEFADDSQDDTAELAAIQFEQQTMQAASHAAVAHTSPEELQEAVTKAADVLAEVQQIKADDAPDFPIDDGVPTHDEYADALSPRSEEEVEDDSAAIAHPQAETTTTSSQEDQAQQETTSSDEGEEDTRDAWHTAQGEDASSEETILNAEERLNEEIEELLALLGLSQSMIKVTNEMLVPPEGEWNADEGCRAIVNPGGVGQPRDGDPRTAFMIYDTENGFTFYRLPYPFEKTQEKILKVGLPPYLATRLAYGR